MEIDFRMTSAFFGSVEVTGIEYGNRYLFSIDLQHWNCLGEIYFGRGEFNGLFVTSDCEFQRGCARDGNDVKTQKIVIE